jgi:hypothetical protein
LRPLRVKTIPNRRDRLILACQVSPNVTTVDSVDNRDASARLYLPASPSLVA